MEDAGYAVDILVGYYVISGSLPKKAIKYIFNLVIKLLGRRAMFIAPYYIVYGNLRGDLSRRYPAIPSARGPGSEIGGRP